MKKIAIHSVPRSGSTWLGELFNSHPEVSYKYQPLFSYAFKGKLTSTSSSKEIDQFFLDIDTSDEFLDQEQARGEGKMPHFDKANEKIAVVYKEVRYHHILTNMLKENPTVKVIGLIRNPMAVVHSWLNAPKEFRKDLGWKELEEWKFAVKKNQNKPEEFNGFEKWKEVALLFEHLTEEFPNQFKLISYAELLKNTEQIVTEVFSFCDLKLDEQTSDFIRQSVEQENKDAYSVYKVRSKDDKYLEKLSPIIIEEIKKELTNTSLEKYLD